MCVCECVSGCAWAVEVRGGMRIAEGSKEHGRKRRRRKKHMWL